MASETESDDEAPSSAPEGERGGVGAPAGSDETSSESNPGPAEKRASRAWLLLPLLGVLALALIFFELRAKGGSESNPGSAEGGDGMGTGGIRAPIERPPLKLSGKIWLEEWPEGVDPADPPQLVPPGERGCRVVAWQAGRLLGETDDCEADGSWVLEIDSELEGTVAVEHLVPGRLRGLVEIEVEGRGEFTLPEVALGLGYPVQGLVIDQNANPIPNIRIEAMPRPDLGESEPWRVTSGPDGGFLIDTLPMGPVELTAMGEGYATGVVDALVPDQAVEIIMEPLVTLRGDVIADASQLEGAKVRLEGSAVWPPIERDLDIDPNAAPPGGGSFAFEALTEGVYGVEVYTEQTPEARAGGAPEYASVPLENVEPGMRITLGLVQAFRVPVKVVDPNGEPVPSARVTVSYGTVGMLAKVAVADLEGSAEPGPFVPGPYWARADADGYLPAVPVAVDVGMPNQGRTEPTVLVLARPATIEGRVVDELGAGIANAEVILETDEAYVAGESEARASLFEAAAGLRPAGTLGVTTGPVPPIPAENEPDVSGDFGFALRTDEEGYFTLEMLPPGEYELRAADGMHAESAPVSVSLESGELRQGIELVLRGGAPLSGRVLDGNGQPVQGVQVYVGNDTLATDDAGVFEAGMRRGNFDIVVRAPGMVPQRIRVKMGEDPEDLQIEMEPANGVVELRAIDGNGAPIKDAELLVQADDGLSTTSIGWTDDAGVVRLEGLTPGKGTMRILHPDYVAIETNVKVDDLGERLEVELDAGWGIDVLVREAGTGAPLEDAMVVSGSQSASTNKDGIAELRRLSGAQARVEVGATGYTEARLKGARPDDPERPIELLAELERAASLSGSIIDDVGDPVRGAKITVRAGSKTVGETRSDGKGEFSFEGLPPGEVTVEATPTKELEALVAPASESVELRRGEATEGIQLRFERG